MSIPKDRRQEYTKEMSKARKFFSEKRIFDSVEALHRAADIFPNSPDLENLHGACLVELRHFEKATEHFNKALALAPGEPTILFNVAEIQFVTGKWQEAHDNFTEILAKFESKGAQPEVLRLCEFKIMLCNIKLGNIDKARETAKKYDEITEDTPFPYYAEAAIHYYDDEKVEAQAAISRARRVFQTPEALAPWHDTLMEFGYIPSFYGNEGEVITE